MAAGTALPASVNPALRWRATWADDPRSHATDGTGMSGDIEVGRVWYDSMRSEPRWLWSLAVTGAGTDRTRFQTFGDADDKDEAKAGLQTAWLTFLALAEPDRLHELRWRYGPQEERIGRRRSGSAGP